MARARLASCALAIATIACGALVASPGRAQSPSPCLGDVSAQDVQQLPGPRLRFGITPAGMAGALGPSIPFVPDQPARTLAALARLRPSGGPFVLRLNRLFWSDGEAGIERFLDLVRRYTGEGYLVELQVRYHPPAGHDGDIPGFLAFVEEVVRRFGSNPRVVGAQITNEVNFAISPDSSDGAYAGARDALIQGVIAAKEEARRLHYDQLEIGFNWVYRTDPETEASFWGYLRDHGGPRFLAALDWIGLDAYPGTVFPPAEPPGGERDGMVNAMSQLRDCFAPIAGIKPSVPIHVEENGWPTGPGRSEDAQTQALQTMVRAVNGFRGTYNVSDYRWFDLRDHNTSSENFQSHYGLLRDDYGEKPAFDAYRRLVAELTIASRPAVLRLALHARRRGRGCVRAHLRATVRGDVGDVRQVDFLLGRRRVARDSRPPFTSAIPVRRIRPGRRATVRALVVLGDGRGATLRHVVRRCAPGRR